MDEAGPDSDESFLVVGLLVECGDSLEVVEGGRESLFSGWVVPRDVHGDDEGFLGVTCLSQPEVFTARAGVLRPGGAAQFLGDDCRVRGIFNWSGRAEFSARIERSPHEQ